MDLFDIAMLLVEESLWGVSCHLSPIITRSLWICNGQLLMMELLTCWTSIWLHEEQQELLGIKTLRLIFRCGLCRYTCTCKLLYVGCFNIVELCEINQAISHCLYPTVRLLRLCWSPRGSDQTDHGWHHVKAMWCFFNCYWMLQLKCQPLPMIHKDGKA